MTRHIEDDHQQSLIRWARMYRQGAEKLFAIPNGGKRDAREAGRMKAQGVTAGIPDLCLPVMRGGFGALYLEIKAPKTGGGAAGRLTPSQSAKLDELSQDGYMTAVCWGWQPAAETIKNYLSM